jgi:lactoylglutathione lyase
MTTVETSGQRNAAAAGDFRFLHTMLRVRDLEKSLDFYTRLLGMRVLMRRDFPTGRFTLAFVGYGEDRESCPTIELTYNWDQAEPYSIGTAFGHLALGVSDLEGTCARLAGEGVPIPRPPGPMKHGGAAIAFIEDPEGYRIELIARA